jgi:hypothetical protein
MGPGSRWLVAVLSALGAFAGCWIGLAAERVLDTGSRVGVASVPLVVVLTVLGAWAERSQGKGGRRDWVSPGERSARSAAGAWEQMPVAPSGTWGVVPAAAEATLRGLQAAVTRSLTGQDDSRYSRFGLPAHWKAADSSLCGEWAGQAHPGDQEAGPSDSVASGGGIAAEYAQLSTARRLVILGEACSGKTTLAMRLVLDWQKIPELSGQVAVPVQVDTWNPNNDAFCEWFSRRLASSYALDAAQSRGLALSLRVVPVLDGFDGLAPDRQRAALERLNNTERPFVLVSRTAQYEAAVLACKRPLHAAAAIVLQDLSPTEDAVARYLDSGSTRWDEVVARLKSSPDDLQSVNLRSALSTPLLIRLAREKYTKDNEDPGLLLDVSAFATRQDIEDHIIQGTVSAAFRKGRSSGGPSRRERKASQWLGFLAGRTRGGTNQVCWWQLEEATFLQGLVSYLLGAALLGVASGLVPVILFGSWLSGWMTPTVGIVGGFLGLVNNGIKPPGTALPVPSLKNAPLLLRRWLGGIIVGLIFGIAVAVLVLIAAKDPNIDARQSIVGKALFFFPLLAAMFLVYGFPRRDDERIDSPAVGSPVGLLKADRTATFAEFSILALAFSVSLGALAALSASGIVHGMSTIDAFYRGLVLGTSYAAVYVFITRAWLRWNLLAKIPLAFFRLQPWRPIKFLEYAQEKGILRHAGLAYEFRTESLRRHLSGVPKEKSPSGYPSIIEWVGDTIAIVLIRDPASGPDSSDGFDNPG